MEYRRFGKTELQMPVVSCGGMRYQHGWGDVNPADITAEGQENLENCIRRALELGITHIETARGYGSSEYQLGKILPKLPREGMIVQTKTPITEDADSFVESFNLSMKNLQLDHVDLLGIHGINNEEALNNVMNKGLLEAARDLQRQGRVRHVGFSTHSYNRVVIKAIETGAFDYVNLHYYYFDQLNLPSIEAATKQDMGVFIISPTDKGGLLHKAPEKLRGLCAPLDPITFNALFCLKDPRIHTLSCGAAKPSDFDAICEAADKLPEVNKYVDPIIAKLEAELLSVLGQEWLDSWQIGLPEPQDAPDAVALYHTLRLFNCYKAFDMLEYGKSRYNLLGNGGSWFPGRKVEEMDWNALPAAVAGSPISTRMQEALQEAHEAFRAEDKKRLSES